MKHLVLRSFLVLSLIQLGCSDPDEQNDTDAGQVDMASDLTWSYECVDLEVLSACSVYSDCDVGPCPGDQVCQDAACIPWETADLTVDFALTVDPEDPLKIAVLVESGGFPRAHVDALRFSFGDGIAGWGEDLSHTYRQGGVYPVTLVVRLAGYKELRVTKLAVVDPPGDHNPLRLTVNDIPTYLNGSESVMSDNFTPGDPSDDVEETFRLQVPNDHFDINLSFAELPDAPIDRSTIKLRATLNGSTTDLSPSIVDDPQNPFSARVEITDANPLEIGMVELELNASTTDGTAHTRTLTVEIVRLTPALDPFDRPMVWLLRDDTDFFDTIRVEAPGMRYGFSSTAGANGEPDFIEELTLMGAQGPDAGINATYHRWIRDAITTECYRIFGMAPDGTPQDGIDFKIVWIGDAGAPSPERFSTTGEFSMMRLGGVFQGYMGYSAYEVHNEERVDDSTAEFGVASAGVLGALTSTFGIGDAFNAINFQTGFVVGEHPSDALVFSDDFDPYGSADAEAVIRYFELKAVARNIAYGLAPVITHEMGHAMGLMPNGLPPQGFFGNRSDISFVDGRTNSHHTDLPGLNLMQAGGDTLGLLSEFDRAVERDPRLSLVEVARLLSLETRLSPLSRAYLQRKLTYGATP